MTKTSTGYSYPVSTMQQIRISVALRESHGTLPEGPIDVYSWERPVEVFGESSRRQVGSWTCYQWFASGEKPPEGAKFVERIRV